MVKSVVELLRQKWKTV